MNDKMKIRLGIGLVGMFTFAGSLFLISKSENAGTTSDMLLPAFRTNEPTLQPPVPDSSLPFPWEKKNREDDDEETFMPQFQPPVQLPQTRTRAS